jgi:type II secretory pathway pseudopilin PulG
MSPKTSAVAATGDNGAFRPQPPSVNLLPPEVKAARGLRVLQRWLALLIALVLVGCVAAYALVSFAASSAQDDLTAAQQRTSELLLEQKRYSDVPVVLSALSDAQTARELAMSTEVPWRSYLDAITAVLPAGVSIDSYSTSLDTVMTAAPITLSPLQTASVGQIQFTLRVLQVPPDTAALIDALDGIPGLTDAWVGDATLTADQDGFVYYAVAASVNVTSSAYTNRFLPDDAADGASGDAAASNDAETDGQ